MKRTWVMTVAALKMYLRQRETVIWAFFFPLLLLGLFGFIRFDGVGTLHLGVSGKSLSCTWDGTVFQTGQVTDASSGAALGTFTLKR